MLVYRVQRRQIAEVVLYTKVLVNDIVREDSGVKLESLNRTNGENFRLEYPVGFTTLNDEKLQMY